MSARSHLSPPRLEPPEPLADDLLSRWELDPDIAFLNHGSFGARPRRVSQAQASWRRQLESRPIEMLERRRDGLLGEAKAAVGGFLGMDGSDFGFVTNATSGINAILRSLQLDPGDQLLSTNHVYNAVRQTLRYIAERSGAGYREIEIPLPVHAPSEVLTAIERALSPTTRLLIIDHIASPTAVRFPVKEIIELCRDRQVDVLVDGAHAPGMIELDVTALDAAYYVGNLHKWVCAPLGTGFLWVRRDRQPVIHPTTISHFRGEGLARELSWQGTRDITAWITVTDALGFFDQLQWPRVMRHNHDLAAWVQQTLCEAWAVEPSTPPDGSMIGAMVTVALPPGARRYESIEQFQRALMERYRIEIPVIDWDGRWWVRPSCQLYNTPRQYRQLADAVLELAGTS